MRHLALHNPRLPRLYQELVQRSQPQPERIRLFNQIHTILKRVSDADKPGTDVELLGSIHNGTALDDSDCDFMWMNDDANECTRAKRRDIIMDAVAEALTTAPELRQQCPRLVIKPVLGAKASTIKLTMFEQPGGTPLTVEFDIVFNSSSYAPASYPQPVPIPNDLVREAVRGVKLLQRAMATALPQLKGYKIELLASLAHKYMPSSSSTTGFDVFRETMLFLDQTKGRGVRKLEERAVQLCPFPMGTFLDGGQLRSWTNQARSVLRLLWRYDETITTVQHLEDIWANREPLSAADDGQPPAAAGAAAQAQGRPTLLGGGPGSGGALLGGAAVWPAGGGVRDGAAAAQQSQLLLQQPQRGVSTTVEGAAAGGAGAGGSDTTGRLLCPQCSRQFDRPQALQQHWGDTHGSGAQQTGTTPAATDAVVDTTDGRLHCSQCGRQYDSAAALRQHQTDTGHGTASVLEVAPSVITGVGGVEVAAGGAGRLKCGSCNRQFDSVESLQQHQEDKGHSGVMRLAPGLLPAAQAGPAPQQAQQLRAWVAASHPPSVSQAVAEYMRAVEAAPSATAAMAAAVPGPVSVPLVGSSGAVATDAAAKEGSSSDSTGAGRLACTAPGCLRSFDTPQGLEQHLLDAHGVAPGGVATCSTCRRRFPTLEALQDHQQRQHGVPVPGTYPCAHCSSRFPTLDALQNHQLVQHGVPVPGTYPCAHCSSRFSDAAALARHALDAHGIAPAGALTCSSCRQLFDTDIGLAQHMLTRHGQAPAAGSGLVACPTCSKLFRGEEACLAHQKVTGH